MGVGNKDKIVSIRLSEDTYRELQKKDKNVSRVIRGMIANELIKERGDYLKGEDRRIKNDSAVFVKFCCTQAGITEEQFYEELQKLIWDDKVVFENGKIILKSGLS